MFTEKDYAGYFAALQDAERKMISNLDKILFGISDNNIREVLLSIKEDEFRHLKLEKELISILKLHSIQL